MKELVHCLVKPVKNKRQYMFLDGSQKGTYYCLCKMDYDRNKLCRSGSASQIDMSVFSKTKAALYTTRFMVFCFRSQTSKTLVENKINPHCVALVVATW